MKVLVDTDVILDLLLDRAPFADAAEELFSRGERGEILLLAAATSMTTIHYLCQKATTSGKARDLVTHLLQLVEIAPVTRRVLEGALHNGFGDYEDGVIHEAAQASGAEAIVTRNTKDFVNSSLPVFTSNEIVKALQS